MDNEDNVVTLTDDEGKETKFEIVTALEVDDNEYYVLYPVDNEEEDAIVLRLDVDDNGEEILSTIEDDDEFEKVEAAYEEWLEEEDDEDEDGCGCGCDDCGCDDDHDEN